MVSTVGELCAARAVLAEAAGEDGLPAGLRVGMMVEVPAAALKIESFLPHLDFVSIGTNDLTQYTLAAERGNRRSPRSPTPLDPGVLQLIDRVCRAARGRVDVAVCGEVGLRRGRRPAARSAWASGELSVGPHAVPGVKARVRELDLEQCEVVAEQALTLAGAAEVRELVVSKIG